jgi:hypothetical protein
MAAGAIGATKKKLIINSRMMARIEEWQDQDLTQLWTTGWWEGLPGAHYGVGHSNKGKDGSASFFNKDEKSIDHGPHNKALGHQDTRGQAGPTNLTAMAT